MGVPSNKAGGQKSISRLNLVKDSLGEYFKFRLDPGHLIQANLDPLLLLSVANGGALRTLHYWPRIRKIGAVWSSPSEAKFVRSPSQP